MATLVAAFVIGIPAVLLAAWPLIRARREPFREAPDDERHALEGEKRLALQAIRELERERETGLLTEDDYADLRARYEARASSILRRLDGLGPPPAPVIATARPSASSPTPVVQSPWTQRPAVLAGGGLVLLLFGVALGALVVRHTGPDPATPMASLPAPPGMVVETTPGEARGPGGGESARPIPEGMLEGMLRAAHESLDAERYQEAIAAYKAILSRRPDNVEAITHLGVILSIAGHADGALEAFDRALAIDPNYAHALWDKARVLYEARQDYTGAIATWERFIGVAPEGPDRDQAVARIREARERLAAAPTPSAPAPPARRPQP